MKKITHRSAIDDITDGISTTWCGLTLSLFKEESFSNDPTCEKCKKEIAREKLKISKVCFKCAYMDLTLPITEQYRCHTHLCPDNNLSREEINEIVKDKKIKTASIDKHQ